MGNMESFTPIPPAAVSRVLATFDRDQLAGFIAVAIDLLDLADGDTELEETDTEDAFELSWIARGYDTGPGCPIADAGGAAEREDDEEDDDSGQCTEDEISAGDRRFGTRGPGCVISDEGGCEHDGTEPRDYCPLPPRYGDDQSKGPINQVEIARDHHRRLMEDPNYQ